MTAVLQFDGAAAARQNAALRFFVDNWQLWIIAFSPC
jgi:hypothetical protein